MLQMKLIILTNKLHSYILESTSQIGFNKWVWKFDPKCGFTQEDKLASLLILCKTLVIAKLYPLQRLFYHQWLILIWTIYILISTLWIRHSCWTGSHTRCILIPELNVANRWLSYGNHEIIIDISNENHDIIIHMSLLSFSL